MIQFQKLIEALNKSEVKYVIVGGFAGTLHGASRVTQDLDIVYARDKDNLRKISAALAPFRPYPREAPPGLPFLWDEETLEKGFNFTLSSTQGYIDLLGEVAGGGEFDDLQDEIQEAEVYGLLVPFITLKALIKLKRAAGRPKDLQALAELEAMYEDLECQKETE